MILIRPWAALGLALVTWGCASTSDHATELRSAYDAGVSQHRGGDPHAFEGPSLDRRVFLREVAERNPSIESARQAWRGALARIRQAGAFEDPLVEVAVAPLSIGSSSARFGLEASVSQKLPWFGKRAFESAVSVAEADAVHEDFEAARRDLAVAASGLYDDWVVALRSIEINAHHVELVKAMRADASAQIESGRGTLADSLQAETELTHLEHEAVVLTVDRDVVVAQMNELLHREPRASLPPPPRDVPALAASLTADADKRPEIEAARARARAEDARVHRAERESWPDVSVSTSYNTMWDMPEHRWMVGLGLNVPIQTGRRAGGVEEAEAARARYESEVLRLTDATRSEVAIAEMRFEESKHLLSLFESRLLPVARDRIAAARAAFVSSRAPFGSVIEAERNLRDVELMYEMARADANKRAARLDRARGSIVGGAP